MTNQELRNQIIITLLSRGDDAKNVVRVANTIMTELYGKNWDVIPVESKVMPVEYGTDETPFVSITEKDGQQWVRVRVGDEDFLIASHDYKKDGKDKFTWEEACKIETANKKQWLIIAAFKEQINSKLKEIGGDVISNKDYWSVQEYNADYAWCYYGGGGLVSISNKRNSVTVRPVLALEVNS